MKISARFDFATQPHKGLTAPTTLGLSTVRFGVACDRDKKVVECLDGLGMNQAWASIGTGTLAGIEKQIRGIRKKRKGAGEINADLMTSKQQLHNALLVPAASLYITHMPAAGRDKLQRNIAAALSGPYSGGTYPNSVLTMMMVNYIVKQGEDTYGTKPMWKSVVPRARKTLVEEVNKVNGRSINEDIGKVVDHIARKVTP